MGRHICLKEWVNGNEISVSIDDNLCDKFRAEVVIFPKEDNMKSINPISGSRCLKSMSEDILKAVKVANESKGVVPAFETRVLVGHESL